jgi:N utilization substance protein B
MAGETALLSLKQIRRKAREIALQVLYQREVTQEPLEVAWKYFCEHYHPLQVSLDYAWELVKGVTAYQITIDLLIERYASGWRIERMSFIDRNILRLAVYEMLYVDDVPPKVSINEAIELAKLYGAKTSPAFVNGILDAIYHKEVEGKR